MAKLTYEQLKDVHINPKLMLFCAELVAPGMYELTLPYAAKYPVVQEKIGNGYTVEKFDPLYNNAQAHALEDALMQHGNGNWVFGKQYVIRDERYWAISSFNGYKVFDETRAILLYKCASLISGLDL